MYKFIYPYHFNLKLLQYLKVCVKYCIDRYGKKPKPNIETETKASQSTQKVIFIVLILTERKIIFSRFLKKSLNQKGYFYLVRRMFAPCTFRCNYQGWEDISFVYLFTSGFVPKDIYRRGKGRPM